MPLYDYDCAACGRRFEVVHGVHADGPTTCPLCGSGPVRKAVTAAAVHFKGSGWAKKERHTANASAAKSAAEGSGSSGGDGAPATTETPSTPAASPSTTAKATTTTKPAADSD